MKKIILTSILFALALIANAQPTTLGASKLQLRSYVPSYQVTFSNQTKAYLRLDFNSDTLKAELLAPADSAANLFLDYLVSQWPHRFEKYETTIDSLNGIIAKWRRQVDRDMENYLTGDTLKMVVESSFMDGLYDLNFNMLANQFIPIIEKIEGVEFVRPGIGKMKYQLTVFIGTAFDNVAVLKAIRQACNDHLSVNSLVIQETEFTLQIRLEAMYPFNLSDASQEGGWYKLTFNQSTEQYLKIVKETPGVKWASTPSTEVQDIIYVSIKNEFLATEVLKAIGENCKAYYDEHYKD